jgi:hypothetical protein
MKEYLAELVNFIGYGRLDAPLWFLGREEGLGKRPRRSGWSLEWELKQRLAWQPVMDARRAHETLQDPYWEAAGEAKVWNLMSMLARGLLYHAPDWQDSELAVQYTVNSLGRVHGQTLLGEAFPLPKAKISSWPYTELFPDQKAYKTEIWPRRQAMWQHLLAEHQPRIVIAYGGWWQSRRDTFGALNWRAVGNSQVQTAIMTTGSQVYLAPFFGRGKLTAEDMLAIIDSAARLLII